MNSELPCYLKIKKYRLFLWFQVHYTQGFHETLLSEISPWMLWSSLELTSTESAERFKGSEVSQQMSLNGGYPYITTCVWKQRELPNAPLCSPARCLYVCCLILGMCCRHDCWGLLELKHLLKTSASAIGKKETLPTHMKDNKNNFPGQWIKSLQMLSFFVVLNWPI